MFLKGKTALITGSTSGIGGDYSRAAAAVFFFREPAADYMLA